MTDEERRALVSLRLQNAKDTLIELPVLIEHGFWNTTVSRMYYACYYAVAALLLKHGICVKTHSGIRQAFSKEFVLTGQRIVCCFVTPSTTYKSSLINRSMISIKTTAFG